MVLFLSCLGTTAPFKSEVPRPRDFSKALYTIDIGQNDLAYGFQHTNEEKVLASIPDILNVLSGVVHVSILSQFVSSLGMIKQLYSSLKLMVVFHVSATI